MKHFLYGFLTAILLFLFSKEVIYYRYLVEIDRACTKTETDFSCNHSKEGLATFLQSHLQRGYFGETFTSRCSTLEGIKYFGCDKLQLYIDKHLHKESK